MIQSNDVPLNTKNMSLCKKLIMFDNVKSLAKIHTNNNSLTAVLDILCQPMTQ